MRLAERAILLIGSIGPLERRVALRLAEEGASLIIACPNVDRGARLVDEIEAMNAEAALAEIDPRDATSLQTAVGDAVLNYGGIDGWVHLLPGQAPADLMECDDGAIETMLDQSVRSACVAARAALPFLKHSPSGSMVFVMPTDAHSTSPRSILSAISCGALTAMTKSLAIDGGPQEIRVNAIAAGFVETDETRRRIDASADPTRAYEREIGVQPLGRFGRPRDIANAVLFMLSDESQFVTGTTLFVDGGRHIVARDLYS